MENDEFVSRRKHPRHNLRDVVSVVDKASGQSVGTVANLSLEGLMLVNSKPLNPDCIYQLRLNIDGAALGAAQEIELGVDCLWSSPAASVPAAAYWSGCQIIDVSEKDFAVITKLIDSLATA